MLYLSCEKNENKQKEAGFGPFFFKKNNCYLCVELAQFVLLGRRHGILVDDVSLLLSV